MAKIERFEDLDCWKKSRQLMNVIYDICEARGLSRDFTTQDQLKRAVLSTMNNIAEGFGRYSNREFARFLVYSSSSSMEVRSMLYMMLDRKYIDKNTFDVAYQLTVEHTKLTLGLIKYLKRSFQKSSPTT
jgi:four helix bundle protein